MPMYTESLDENIRQDINIEIEGEFIFNREWSPL